MKLMVCGKGGSGKSTLAVLLAKALVQRHRAVTLIDADESNLSLHRLLGIDAPVTLMEDMGGRVGTKAQLKAKKDGGASHHIFDEKILAECLPDQCVVDADGIRLLSVGKIKDYGEGCACIVGAISRNLLGRFDTQPNDMVLVDAEAGVEQFGRKVTATCDLLLDVIDPTFESVQLAARMQHMARKAGQPIIFVLNKHRQQMDAAIAQTEIDPKAVIARIPEDPRLFEDGLYGRPLAHDVTGVDTLADYIAAYHQPPRLNVL